MGGPRRGMLGKLLGKLPSKRGGSIGLSRTIFRAENQFLHLSPPLIPIVSPRSLRFSVHRLSFGEFLYFLASRTSSSLFVMSRWRGAVSLLPRRGAEESHPRPAAGTDSAGLEEFSVPAWFYVPLYVSLTLKPGNPRNGSLFLPQALSAPESEIAN